MPNGRTKRKYSEFGVHNYAGHDGTSDCAHGCGCWMGPAMSGSNKMGVDPFGKCPFNVPDEMKATDHEDLVEGRIRHLESENYSFRIFKETVEKARNNSKIWLQLKVSDLEAGLALMQRKAEGVKQTMEKLLDDLKGGE